MRVLVTALKAPWPAGTQIGDIVDLPGRAAVPEWAVGKCEPAPASAEPAAQREPAEATTAPATKRAGGRRGA